jgi:AraC-like DNA-binding protein
MILEYQHLSLGEFPIVEKYKFESPFRVDASLRNEACFMHVIQGRSDLYTPNGKIEIEKRDNFVMKCGSYLNDWKTNEKGEPNEAIVVHFYPDVLKEIYENELPNILKNKQTKQLTHLQKVQSPEMLNNYLESLFFYIDNPGVVTDELIKLKVKELILLLVNTEDSEKLKSLLSNLFTETEYKFKEIIQAHLFEDLRLQDLAILTGTSLSTFKRKFNKVFGTSPNQYIKSKRLEKAMDLISHTEMRISDIAYDCGFNDLGYFSKSFTSEFGKAPTAFRKDLVVT